MAEVMNIYEIIEKKIGVKPEKLIDNFMSSPGSGHFGEMGQRASVMQQQGAATMERVNAILRSVLNLIYDLKEFKVRLQSYSDLKDPIKKESAILSLKQWQWESQDFKHYSTHLCSQKQ